MRVYPLSLILVFILCIVNVIALNDNAVGHSKHALRRHQQEKGEAQEKRKEECKSNDNANHHGVPGGSIVAQLQRTPNNVDLFLRASSYMTLFDANKDDVLDLNEIKTAVQFPWSGEEQAWLAQRVLDLPDAEALMAHFDKDKDGRITMDELQSSLRRVKKHHEHEQKRAGKPVYRKRTECQKELGQKLDQCKTSDILRCQGYAHFAEMQCMFGKDVSPVQECFQKNACGNICGCIAELENKAKQSHKIQSSVQTHVEKRLIPFFLGFALTDILALAGVFGGALGAISVQLLRQRADLVPSLSTSAFLDPVVWNGVGSPPSCSMYLYWSQSCGAIWSGGARNCNPLGERMYGNSCKDHFRFGSRGCGFLNLGCQSLCWGTELSGCKCDLFNYDVHPDTAYPGHVVEATHVGKISECSDRCTARSDCVAFEIPPLTVEGKNVYNCFLKDGGDDPVQQVGTTTFTRIQRTTSAQTNKCNVGQADFAQVPYGTDWSDRFGDTFERRDGKELNHTAAVTRQLKPNNGGSSSNLYRYRGALGLGPLLVMLYNSRTDRDALRNLGLLTVAGNAQWMMEQAPPVPYVAGEPVQNLNGGGWTFAEVQVRVLNNHRRMMELGSATAFVDEARQTAEGRRQIPQAVRDVIAANDNLIYNNVGDTMLHAHTTVNTNNPARPVNFLQTLHDIQMPYDTNVEYVLQGGVGPIGLDAAFVLATQAAGINYQNVHASAQAARGAGRGAGDYTASVVRSGSSQQAANECITVDVDFAQGGSTSSTVRDYAVVYQDPTHAYNDNARGGFYFAFDVDPSAGSNSRNLFVFAVHTTDRRSYIVQHGDPLNNPSLSSWNLFRTGGSRTGSERPPNYRPVRQNAANLNPPNGNANTRALAHAHAGVVDRDVWLTWIQNGQVNGINGPPLYTQMHQLHLFLHPDDTDPSRIRFQNHGGANPHGTSDDESSRRRGEEEKNYLAGNALAFARSQLNKLAGNVAMMPINFGPAIGYRF